MASSEAVAARPAPQPDRDSEFYWQGLRHARLRLQRCSECERHRFPPLPACPDCGARDFAIEDSAGRGVLYSWITVHRAFSPAFRGDVPYSVGVVELDEGCRVLARLELGGERPRIGMSLESGFTDRGDWTELTFREARGGDGAS